MARVAMLPRVQLSEQQGQRAVLLEEPFTGAAGTGSMVGAVSGAVWGLMRGLFYASPSQPDQAYANFVTRCLQEKGYEVTGWQ
ncbi:hypothetical protein SAMN05421755_100861 [Nitrosomonas sp. Nm33]|nr:hypothetical protein SAMN05421755_100861 [Nitrosomonas sp. Nm33]